MYYLSILPQFLPVVFACISCSYWCFSLLYVVSKWAEDNGYEEGEGAASTYLLLQKGHKKKHIMQQSINGLGPYETDVSYGLRCSPPLLRWKPEMLEMQWWRRAHSDSIFGELPF